MCFLDGFAAEGPRALVQSLIALNTLGSRIKGQEQLAESPAARREVCLRTRCFLRWYVLAVPLCAVTSGNMGYQLYLSKIKACSLTAKREWPTPRDLAQFWACILLNFIAL